MAAARAYVATGLKSLGKKVQNSIKTALTDYKNAAKDSWTSMKEKPLKAAVYCGTVALGIQLCLKRPVERTFVQSVVDEVNNMALVSECTRNKDSYAHLQNLSSYLAKGQIRCQNMLFFSIIYSSDYDKDNKFYESQCKHLKPSWLDFHNQILDIGCWGRWWMLRYHMTDYDVNFDELPKDLDNSFETLKDFFTRLAGVSYFGNPAIPLSEQSRPQEVKVAE